MVRELTPAPDPAQACETLAGLPSRVFLDSATPRSRLGRYSFLTADPVASVRSKGLLTQTRTASTEYETVHANPFDVVRRWMAPFGTTAVEGLPPFQGGAAGYIGYEFGRTLEPISASRYDDLDLPDLVLGLYDWVIAWDHSTEQAWLISTGMPEIEPKARRTRARDRLDTVVAMLSGQAGPGRQDPPVRYVPGAGVAPSYAVDEPRFAAAAALRSSFTRAGYMEAVTAVREFIAAGDIFQANLSQRFEAPLRNAPWALYSRLRVRNAAPFAAFLDFPDATILSASPERFLRVTPDGWAETRPIKGTRPRGFGPEHDAHLGRELSESLKDQAENLMIVDLMRNDLSRVCRPGSVRVSELFALEHYATVHHLVSTVVGHLEQGSDALSLLLASFPAGSITGAPKIRAREIIAQLEPSERGVYCGAIGYLSTTGALDTNVAIRTAVAKSGRLTFSAGGGITFNSDPAQEYRETLDKAHGMIDTLATADGSTARQP